VPWVEVFAVFLVSHLVGDLLFQTDWQARHKHRGLGRDPVALRALLTHVGTYTLAFVPALVWLASDIGGAVAALAAGVLVPHALQDDGRLVSLWLTEVKGADIAEVPVVGAAVDQAMHIVTLFGLALLAGG